MTSVSVVRVADILATGISRNIKFNSKRETLLLRVDVVVVVVPFVVIIISDIQMYSVRYS